MKLFSLIICSFIIFSVHGEEKCSQEKNTLNIANNRLDVADRRLNKRLDTSHQLSTKVLDIFQNKWKQATTIAEDAQNNLERAIKSAINDPSEENEQKVKEANEATEEAIWVILYDAIIPLQKTALILKNTTPYHKFAMDKFSAAGVFVIMKKREYENCMNQ